MNKPARFPNKKELNLIPYILDFRHQSIAYHCLYEMIDLSNLKNALIKELTLSSKNPLSQKYRSQLRKLLSNKNIKKINILIYPQNNEFLLFISNLLRKNNTYEEINLVL